MVLFGKAILHWKHSTVVFTNVNFCFVKRAVIVSWRDPKQNTSLAVLPYVNHTVEVFDYVFQATVYSFPFMFVLTLH
jgi:hypothetical protein